MGTALRNLKAGSKLSDGKTIGGAGRLTDKTMNSLQNYYSDAIRRNIGDVNVMMKAVEATAPFEFHSRTASPSPVP